MNYQAEMLRYMLHSGTVDTLDDEAPESDAAPADPVGDFRAQMEFIAAGGPKDFELTDTDALEKAVIANRLGLSTTPYGTAAAMTSASRTETADGDGGPLEKRASDEPVNLAKAASRGRVRFEHELIDGEPWVMGWNDKGENCYASTLEDHEAMHKYSEIS